MYSEVVIEPERDASLAWRDPPTLPTRIIGGIGAVDDQGEPVATFLAMTERACWRLAFDASEWRDFESFKAHLQRHRCEPQPWLAVCPGRDAPARLYVCVVRRNLLEPTRCH